VKNSYDQGQGSIGGISLKIKKFLRRPIVFRIIILTLKIIAWWSSDDYQESNELLEKLVEESSNLSKK
jgi:hypothetical protein